MSWLKRFFNSSINQTIPFDVTAAQERRSLFLRYINRSWFVFGLVTLITLPFFPGQRSIFLFLIAIIFPTYILVRFLNSRGQIILAGVIFTFLVNFGFYGLFLFLVQQLGAYRAFETQGTVLMLMGLAVLFAGALIDKWAAPALAFMNTVLLIGTRLTLAPGAEPRPSVIVLWWMLALTIWLYERILAQAFTRLWDELAERRHAEQEREALFQDLTHKNAELERFIYTASHDLRSPIITIRGFLGYIEEDVRNGNLERLQGDIGRIHGAANKMRDLLDDLLDISRVGRLISPAEQISFREIVQEAQVLTADRLNEKKIELRIDPNLPTVYGDRVRLVEVVQNLIDNAIKFMGNQMNPLIEIGARQQDGGWILFVRDNGMGISPKYHERIFNLFDKLDPQSDGTGIGLAIVKRIIEFHNGRIWVEGEIGQGSTFYFSLPTR